MPTGQKKYYDELLSYARKMTFYGDEAEDLLQTALLAALEANRGDITHEANRRWLVGVLRKQSLFVARTAARRKKREAAVTCVGQSSAENAPSTSDFVNTLPPKLKTTALLILTGHSKLEIAFLLRVSDCALRQRIAQIKKQWRLFDGRSVFELPGLSGELAYGRIRQALLKAPVRNKVTLATHDPSGHLIMFNSQNGGLRQLNVKPRQNEEHSNV
ncbi:sigma factor [Teredinibacter turnerae]|uniref:sigma factor n=1 Tax=Teredinibacter turnerae TaxID=2426 RepID=UPI0030D17437